jgi:HEAT repeat protein
MWGSRALSAPEDALLALAAVAGGGLTRADLMALTGCASDQLDACLAAATRAGLCRRASRWTGETIYLVEDPRQRQDIMAAAEKALLADCAEALHAWAQAYRGLGWPVTTPEYLLDGYFRFLESAGDLARITACATDPRRHERLLKLTGGDTAAAHEVAACQAAIAEQDTPDLAAALVVSRDRLTTGFSKLPASLPATMAISGSPGRAEQLASCVTDPSWQTRALTSLAIALLDHGHFEQARHTLGRLIAVVPAVMASDASHPPHPALAAVTELAAAGQWTSAERVARAITDQWVEAKALSILVSALITDGHLDQAEHLALSIDPGKALPRFEALKSVVDALAASGQHDRAEALARAFPHRVARVVPRNEDVPELAKLTAQALAHLDAGDSDQAEQTAHGARTPFLTEQILCAIAGRLVEEAMTDRAEQLADRLDDRQSQAEVLAAVAAASAAHGDVASARRLAERAAALARPTPGNNPLRLLRFPLRNMADDDARLRAVEDLGEHGDERAAGPLIEALVTEHGPVAAAAAAALDRLDERGHEIAPGVLLGVIDRIQWEHLKGTYGRIWQYVPWEVRSSVIRLMRRRATAEHIPALIESLHHLGRPRSSNDERAYIITQVLREVDEPAGFRALAAELRCYSNPDDRRKRVLDALCPLGPLCTSPENDVRIRPRSARPGQAEVLLELVVDASLLVPNITADVYQLEAVRTRTRVADELGVLGEPRAAQPLLDWLDEIKSALSSVGPPKRNEFGHLTVSESEHAYKDARRKVTTALGRIGGPEVVKAMPARLDD